jgi:metallophosphoesterase (TIGR00282 family)
MQVKILAIGDIVGKPGRALIRERLPSYRREEGVHFVVANAENIAGGSGIMPEDADDLFRSGVDAITCGDHVWAKKEIIPYMDRTPAILRCANYPAEQPGRGAAVLEANGLKVGVIHLQGNVFMNTPAANPFKAADACIAELKKQTPIIVIDMHCEATSEKQAMGHYVDGRVSLVVGTHTHVQTTDHRILSGGTAFISDVGMTGDYDSVIGMAKEEPINRFLRRIPSARFEPPNGPGTLCGIAVETDDMTGLAKRVGAVRLGGILEEATPAFWP